MTNDEGRPMAAPDPTRSLTAYTALSPSLFSTRTAAADALATRLAEEMAERWRRGERPLPEEFLDRHKELWDRPEAAVQLIYEEICLRQEFGEEGPLAGMLDRFPQWREQLQNLLDSPRLFQPPP